MGDEEERNQSKAYVHVCRVQHSLTEDDVLLFPGTEGGPLELQHSLPFIVCVLKNMLIQMKE
jgi:hypothetical protein